MRPEARIESRRFDALGTTCSLFAVGVSAQRLAEGERWVRSIGARLTRFSEDSELSHINGSAGMWVDASAEMVAVLKEALGAYEMSGGLVNVAVLGAMQSIGYTRPLVNGPTAAAVLHRADPLPPLHEVLEVRGGRVYLQPGCGIDLGGIAKGWMADHLCARLGDNVVANLGGDLRAVGAGPAGAGWPIGVGESTLLLRDQGAATSSVRKRRWRDVHHLIDPRTGLPSRSGLDEVSVVAESALRAEIVAKTALLLGRGLAPAYCAGNALAWWLSESHDD